ncbi:MAG: SH3 domain-containing protein [Devosia sp.]|nr:SH3 domain-containing protein [Devosia sp.]
MNISKTLKTAALAIVVVAATAGASLAAQWAWVDHDANVRQFHTNASPVVNWVSEGQKVKIIASWNNWYKLQIPGPDGWVKKNVIDFNPWPNNPWPNNPGPVNGQVCFWGQYGYICLGN